jgi:hypothetical protein
MKANSYKLTLFLEGVRLADSVRLEDNLSLLLGDYHPFVHTSPYNLVLREAANADSNVISRKPGVLVECTVPEESTERAMWKAAELAFRADPMINFIKFLEADGTHHPITYPKPSLVTINSSPI